MEHIAVIVMGLISLAFMLLYINVRQKLESEIRVHSVTATANKKENCDLLEKYDKIEKENVDLHELLKGEQDKNSTVLSQKKSSEIRIGQVAEHLIPFLSKCKYDPKSMHFQGNPIDFIVYDLDQAEVVFLEVKTGNSKLSKRQKTIKNIIKAGKVYYEEIRISPKGVRVKREKNEK
jgi:predicted Holliday junction resolvase-like endonuclease